MRYVQDRDLWTWAYPESAAFLAALDMEPNEFPRWSEIADFTDAQVAEFSERGKAMNEKFLSLCQDIAGSAAPVVFNGQTGVMVNCPGAFTSEVGNILAERQLCAVVDGVQGQHRQSQLARRQNLQRHPIGRSHGRRRPPSGLRLPNGGRAFERVVDRQLQRDRVLS